MFSIVVAFLLLYAFLTSVITCAVVYGKFIPGRFEFRYAAVAWRASASPPPPISPSACSSVRLLASFVVEDVTPNVVWNDCDCGMLPHAKKCCVCFQ